tara:strand:- start:7747 stop:8889 length:1143 start_codon:yes stop_codon:yes gene_type:complete
MAVQIQVRRGTASQWTSANPTLANGELAHETDTGKLKIGDGSTAWSSLAYFTAGSGDITGVDITAGDGLDITQSGTTSGNYTATVSADLKANGGLVIETTELAIDLAASSITNSLPSTKVSGLGTAAVVDTGTGSSNVILGNDARLTDDRDPNAHSADKVTSGTLGVDRIPTLSLSKISDSGTAAGLAVGISNTNVLQADANVADDDFLRVAGTQIEGRTAAETLSDIGASPVAGSSSIVTTGTIATGTWNATAIEDTKLDLRVDHGVTFDGQGSVIESAKTVLVPVERAGVIKAATLVGDASGAITITITKYDPAADATTLGSPSAVGTIALATKIINRDTTLSGWTLAVAEGDILAFTTGGTIATVTRVTCKLKLELA